jgi:hypothetical protein
MRCTICSSSSKLAPENILNNCSSRRRTKETGIEVAGWPTSRHVFLATSKGEKREKQKEITHYVPNLCVVNSVII